MKAAKINKRKFILTSIYSFLAGFSVRNSLPKGRVLSFSEKSPPLAPLINKLYGTNSKFSESSEELVKSLEKLNKLIENEISYNTNTDSGQTELNKSINKLKSDLLISDVEKNITNNNFGAALELIKKENYNYSVLSNSENQQEKTYLIEGSCQTGYFPYSASYLIQFLSTIFPYLKDHITKKNNVSKVYSWIGDKELLKSKGLVITEFGTDNNSYELIINDL